VGSFHLIYFFFFWLFLQTASLNAAVSDLKVVLSPKAQACLKSKRISTQLAEKDYQWTLSCSINEWLNLVQSKQNIKNPAEYFVFLKALHLKMQSEIEMQKKIPFASPKKDPIIDESINKEQRRRQKISAVYIEAAQTLVSKLVDSESKYLFKAEIIRTFFLMLGEGGRFKEAVQLYNDHPRSFKVKRIKKEITKAAFRWLKVYENFDQLNWLKKVVKKQLPKEIKGRTDYELQLNLMSMYMNQLPHSKSKDQERLKHYRKLWLAFPTNQARDKIHKSLNETGLYTEFRPPLGKELKLHELVLLATSQLRYFETDAAKRTLEKTFTLAKPLDYQDLWSAFKLHVKVLKLMNKRHLIENVIEKYLNLGAFLEVKSANENLRSIIKRYYDIARMYWNYTPNKEKTLSIINKIIETGQSLSNKSKLEDAYFIKARIYEKNSDPKIAFEHIDRALSKVVSRAYRENLQWRRFFLMQEQSLITKNIDKSSAYLKKLSKLNRDNDDKAKWHFWMAKNQDIRSKKKANEHYYKAYSLSPFGYYSSLAGLELRKRNESPKKWKRQKQNIWQTKEVFREPKTAGYIFSEKTNSKSFRKFRFLSKSFWLAKVGYFFEAHRNGRAFSTQLWRSMQAKKSSTKEKTQVAKLSSYIRLSVGDYLGAMQVGSLIKSNLSESISDLDLNLLYPLAFYDSIKVFSKKQDVDPWFVISLIRQESAFNHKAKSFANALGLMQMIPPVAYQTAESLNMKQFSPEDLYMPDVSIKLGTAHIQELLEHFDNSWICTLASYNAGSTPVDNWLRAFKHKQDPHIYVERIAYKETRKYVKSILRNYINYDRIYKKQSKIKLSSLLKMPEAKREPAKLSTR